MGKYFTGKKTINFKYMKRCLPSLVREKQIKATMRLFFSCRVSQVLAFDSTLSAFIYIVVEMTNAHIQNDIKH